MGAANAACETLATCREVEARDEFVHAVRQGDVPRAERILDFLPHLSQESLDFGDGLGEIPALGFAIQQRHIPMVVMLLHRGGAEVSLPKHAVAAYEKRAQAAAEARKDPFLLHLVPETYFHSVCAVPHADLFNAMIEAYPFAATSALLFVCHAGDCSMLERLIRAQADVTLHDRDTTAVVAAVKSQIEPAEKIQILMKADADPNLVSGRETPLAVAAKARQYVSAAELLDHAADPNAQLHDSLPTVLFHAVYWGDVEMVELLAVRSRVRLNLGLVKETKEDIFDVAHTALSFARTRKPKSIAKLPLPDAAVEDCERVLRILDEYRQTNAPASSTRCTTGARTSGRYRSHASGERSAG